MTHLLLANADGRDTSFSTISVLLLTVLWLAVIALLALVPLFLAWRRKHPHARFILLLVLFTGLLSLGTAYTTISARDEWSREETLRLQSGYYLPQDHPSDQPALPWPLWTALSTVYAGILLWSATGRR